MRSAWLFERILPVLAGTLIWTAAASQSRRQPSKQDDMMRLQRAQNRTDQTTEEAALARGRESINGYFRATLNRRYAEMGQYLAPLLRRFFGKTDITREQAVAQTREYHQKKGIRVLSYTLRWASAEQQVTATGYQYKFIMNYRIRSKDPSLPKTFLLEVTADLNREFMIESLSEYVIERHRAVNTRGSAYSRTNPAARN